MGSHVWSKWTRPLAVMVVLSGWAASLAYGLSPAEKEALQRQLNQGVMEQPFHVPSEQELQGQLDAAKKRGEVPPAKPPQGMPWQPGWTCANLLPYRNYNWWYGCRYYHYYYHRYWW
jgi:hypothetical protein